MNYVIARRPVNWKTKNAYIMISPGMLLLFIFLIVPIIYALYISFTEFKSGAFVFVGLNNFKILLKSKIFWVSLLNTFYYTVGVIIPSIAVSLFIAMGLNRKGGYAATLRTIYFLPVAISEAIAAAIWQSVLNPDVGIANYILQLLHLPKIGWYADFNWAMPTLIMVSLWKNVGYYMIIFLAGLQTIPQEYYEAASIDGANWWQSFRNITVPLLRPSLFFVYITSIIFSFRVFTWIYVMTQGGPGYSTMVTVYYIYREGFQRSHFGLASAISTILLLILMILIVSQMRQFRLFKTEEEFR